MSGIQASQTMADKARFYEGSRYFGRSICNYDHAVTVEVLRRTPKSVRVRDLNTEEIHRRFIKDTPSEELIRLGPGITIGAKRIIS